MSGSRTENFVRISGTESSRCSTHALRGDVWCLVQPWENVIRLWVRKISWDALGFTEVLNNGLGSQRLLC